VRESDLPSGWAECALKDVGSVVSGGTPSTKIADYWNGDINWISPSDLTGYKAKFITHGAKSISEKGLKYSSAKIMPKGSVHFSSRAPIGYVVISAEALSTNQGFKSLVLFPGIFNEYVYFYLLSIKSLAESLATGTTFKELSGSAFAKLPIPLPPLAEQKRIVAKIEELFSELDAGEASLRQARRQLTTYRQALLKQAFEGKLTETKNEWGRVPLGKLGEWQGGGTPNKANSAFWDNGTIPWVSPKDMKVRKIESAQDRITEKALDESVCKIIAPFSLLLVTRSGILAHSLPIAINLKEVAINQDLKAISPQQGCNADYLWYFFKSHEQVILNTCRKGGTTVHSIEFPALKQVLVPLPSLPEQLEIVRILDEQFAAIDQTERELDQTLAQSAALRQSILRHAFTGQLVPQDPNDEPASELLARIRARSDRSARSARSVQSTKSKPQGDSP
jgi:type I restriction enzyme S subunit